MIVIKLLGAVLVFGIIIFIHELGHFIMAKLTRVRVNEFALGMGPRLFKFGKGETTYSLRLFPIGGFCAMEGEDEVAPMPKAVGGNGSVEEDGSAESASDISEAAETLSENESASKSGSFTSKRVWQRSLIVCAGAVMNLILGYVLLIVYFAFFMMPNSVDGGVLYPTTQIAALPESSLSYQTGLRAEDTILRINGKHVWTDRDIAMLMQSDEDGILDIVVRRPSEDGETAKVRLENVQFELKEDENGQRHLSYDFVLYGIKPTFLNTFSQSAKTGLSYAVIVWRTLGDVVTGKYGLNDLSGPIGTMDVIGDAVGGVVEGEDWRVGFGNLLMLMVLITINVGIFNLLPFPALDGGRLLFLILEGIFRRPIPQKYEVIANSVGMILLLLLMLVVTTSDVAKWFV